MSRIRYVLAGVGGRGLGFFAEALRGDFRAHGELVGLFDLSRARLEGVNRQWGTTLPVYTDFGAMLREVDPDGVIIATSDASHADYVVQTLEAGKRVVCEKPLGVSAAQVRRVLDAAAAHPSPTSVVTHNMRYEAAIEQIKSLIADGSLGQILNILCHENLDRHHGADYFRRWHRFRANSGGLLVQKGSHHFDTLNWLVGSRPRRVVARGGLYHYGRRGPFRSYRCTGCPFTGQCVYDADLPRWAEAHGELGELYKAAEGDTGYVRDGCVFDERIDIEDHMEVLYDYENGVEVVYSLTAFASLESFRLEIEGTEGRLVYEHILPTDWTPGDRVVPGLASFESRRMTLYSFRTGVREIPTADWPPHWKTDYLSLLPELFDRPAGAPLTDRQASLEDGAWAVLVGAAANRSIAEDSQPVDIQALLEGADASQP